MSNVIVEVDEDVFHDIANIYARVDELQNIINNMEALLQVLEIAIRGDSKLALDNNIVYIDDIPYIDKIKELHEQRS